MLKTNKLIHNREKHSDEIISDKIIRENEEHLLIANFSFMKQKFVSVINQ